jgi:phosphatidylglycerophosphate synthase
MLEPLCRPTFHRILVVPLLCLPGIHRISPNGVTFMALLTGLATLPLLALGKPYWALALLILSGYFDILDGSLARQQGVSSQFGTVLDIVSDRIVESAILLGLLFQELSRGPWVAGMFAATLICVTSFLVVGIFAENETEKGFHYSPGLIERLEAFIVFALMILMPQYFTILAASYIVLVLLTSIIRVFEFWRQF